MTKEVSDKEQGETKEIENKENEQQEEKEYNEVELKAIDMGWNPEGVEGKKNLSPDEFIDRKKLYDDLHSVKRSNKRLQERVDALKSHQDHIRKEERKAVLNELKQQKKVALENDEYDSVIEIDDKISDVKAEGIAEEAAEKEDQPNEAFVSWVKDNSWYKEDSEMKEQADILGAGYYATNNNKTPEEVYEYVSKEIKNRYPEHFKTNSKSSPVEGARRNGDLNSRSKGGKYNENDLPNDAREIMRVLIRNNDTTKEKYLKEYFALGE